MSERVQHDEQCSSLHDMWCFRYDEQCSSLHAEGLIRNRDYFSWCVYCFGYVITDPPRGCKTVTNGGGACACQ